MSSDATTSRSTYPGAPRGFRWAPRWPRESPRFWVALVLSVIASIVIERNWDALAVGDGGHAGRVVSSAGAMYQQLVTAGARTTAPRYTTIVDIRPGVEPDSVTLLNICNQRRFVARLVELISAARPSVIVLDKYFGPATCALPSPETEQLRGAIASTIRGGTPVVIGRQLDPQNLKVSAGLPLATGDATPIEGFINLHDDNRRLSLRWVGKVSADWLELPTLAVAAARAHRPDVIDHRRLRQAYDRYSYPYVSFLSEEQFGPYRISAIDLMCGSGRRETDWSSCTGDRGLLQRVRGRVVVIGDNTTQQDQHSSVIGRVPGVLLQANYIEAILDERVFEAVPRWLELLLGILVAIVIEYVVVTSTGPWALLPRLFVVAFLAVGLSYGTVMFLGRYVNPWSVSVVALVLKSVGRIPEWLREGVAATRARTRTARS